MRNRVRNTVRARPEVLVLSVAVLVVLGGATLAAGAGTTSVFQSPADPTVTIEDTTEIDIYAEDVDDVGAFTLSLELSDTERVAIVDIEAAGDPEIQSADPVNGDGASASLSVVYGDNVMDGDGNDLPLATVTIEGLDEGDATLSTTLEAIGNSDGISYDIDIETDTVDIVAVFSPEAAFTVTPEEPVPGDAATFDASDTTTIADEIVEYRWDFTGDGDVDETTADPVTTYAYDEAGEYDVALEVEDSDGDTDTVTRTLLVSERGDLTGVVTDEFDDSAIEGVTVTVLDDGEVASETQTNADGTYDLDVRVGTHTVEFEAPGYGTVTETNVEIVADDTTALDAELFPEGSGTEEDPYLIADIEGLQAIKDEPDAHYLLVADIDAEETEWWNSGHGFEPIEDFTGSLDGQGHEITDLYMNRFTADDEVGLFATTNGAIIKNLELHDVYVRGPDWAVGSVVGYAEEDTHISNVTVTGEVSGTSGGWGVGGIAGAIYDDSSIENVHVDAEVSAGWAVGGIAGEYGDTVLRNATVHGEISGDGYVGGAIGFDWWTEDSESTIKRTTAHADIISDGWGAGGLIGGSGSNVMLSSATGNVTSSAAAAGGLVGEQYWGEINQSSASGNVTGSGSAGGLIGWNDALINQSTASGDVSGDGDIGGLVGQNWNVTTQSYTTGSVSGPDTLGGLIGQNGDVVTESFAAGEVGEADTSGGLIGLNEADTLVTDAYWDVETTGQVDSIGEDESEVIPSLIGMPTTADDDIVELTTDEMTGATAVQTMRALDFETVWNAHGSQYPTLAHEAVEPISDPVAAFTTDPISPGEGQETIFDASSSMAPDSEIVQYEWDFTGDGTIDETASEPTATHTYDDVGDYDVTLTIETAHGDTADITDTVIVEEPAATFDVTIDEDASELHVTEGENATVAVDVENTAGVTDTQPVQLQIDGELIDSVDVTLDGNANTTIELTWETSLGQDGTYDADVVTADDYDSTQILLDESIGFFEIEVLDVNSPVEHGENLTVETHVENTGDGVDQQLIVLVIDGGPADGIPVTLDPGDSTTVTFEVPTDDAPLGEFHYAVHSNDDYDGGTFLILEDPEAPLATFSTSPDEGFEGTVVTFDASESLSPDGDIVEYRWDFTGDGAIDESTADPVTTHTYETIGTYDVRLSVEDETGATASATEPYTVIGAEEISDCATIWQSGSYVLTEDLSTDQTGGSVCLRVTADHVTIDGMGHNITAGDPIEWRGANYGVQIDGATDVSISNVTIQDWTELGTALYVDGSTAVEVEDVTAINNTFGLRTGSVTGFTFDGVEVIDNERAGIQIHSSSDGVVTDAAAIGNAISEGWANVYVRGGSEDIFLDNVTASHGHTNASGIRVTSNSQDVTIANAAAIGNDGAGMLIESASADVANSHVSDNEWGVNVTAADPVTVDILRIDDTDELALSAQASTSALRANTTVPDHPNLQVVGTPVDAWSYSEGELDLRLHYEPDALKGYNLESLELKAYEDGSWSTVEDATVDTDERTVSVSSSGFSTLGLFAMAREPGELAHFDVKPITDSVVQGEPLEVEFVNAVDVNGEPYSTGEDTLTNIDVEHPLDDDPRRVAVEFVDGEATHSFEVLDSEETAEVSLGFYDGLEAWDVNEPVIGSTYEVDIVATRLASFDVQPLNDSILQGEPLEVEFVNAVDIDGEPYTTGDDSWTNIDVEHPYDDDPRRVAVEFVDGEAHTTFEVLDGEETEDLDLAEYPGLDAWDVNDPRISDTYDIKIVATRLASFEVQPLDDAVLQGEPLEVEFVNAVDIDGEPYTTGDDSWTNIDVEHPSDDDPRRVAVEFVDGEAHTTFEVLDEVETEDLDLEEYTGLEAWDVNDHSIASTYDVEIVATRLASFDVQPLEDSVLQGEPLEVEFVDAVDINGDPYTTGDDSWTNIDVEHPYDDDPRRVAVEFVDGEAHTTFEVLDEEETADLDLGEYSGLEAWDVNDPRISSMYDVEIVATRLASFDVQPLDDAVLQGDPLEVEFVNAVNIEGQPYTTGEDSWTNIDVEHPYDDDPRRVAVEFVDGEAHTTFEVLDGDETEALDLGEYSDLEAWDVNDPSIASTYDVEIVATPLASFAVEPVSDQIVQGEPLEVEFVDAVDINGDPYTTGDDSWTNIDVEHPYGDDPRRVAVEFVDGEAHTTFEVLDGEETENLDLGSYSDLEAWDVNDQSISDTYDIDILATRLASFDVQPINDHVLQGEPLELEFVNAVDINGDPYTTGDDSWTNIDVEHPYDDDPRRVAVEFVDGEAHTTFEVLDEDETEDLDLGEYWELEAWDVNDASIASTYDVEVVATRLASFDVHPVEDHVLQGESLELEFVNAVDIDGEPYTTGDDSWTNIDVEHPYDDDPRRVAVEFVDGEAHTTFEVLDEGETEDLDLGEYTGLEAWEVNDHSITSSYDVEIVATRLASFDVQPLDDAVLQGEPLEVEFVNAVDIDGEPYTTGDDSWTNIDVEHPYDDDPRRVAVEFVDGEAQTTFEVLDEDETDDLDLGEYSDLEAWDVNDASIASTYDVEIVATRLASFDVQPLDGAVLQGEPLEVEFVNAVDIDGEPYTTGDDSWTNIDVEHPLDDQPRRVAVEFVDGEAHTTFEVLDSDETDTLDLDEYAGLAAWDVNDASIESAYDVAIVATRLASFDVQPINDHVLQGEPLELEFVNAVDINGEPYTTGEDSWTNIDVEHPYDDDPRRVAVEFVDGEAHTTFEVLDEDETDTLDLDEYAGLAAWDVNDASIASTYDVDVVATRLASFDIELVNDAVLQGEPLEVEFVNAVDINGEPYTTGDDSWTNIDVEHPYDDDPRRVAVEFVDGEAHATFEVLDAEETEDVAPDFYTHLEAWDVNDPSISDTYNVLIEDEPFFSEDSDDGLVLHPLSAVFAILAAILIVARRRR